MARLPAVSVRRRGAEGEVSFRADVVEDVLPGQAGYVTLKGGPSIHGVVREARAVPLREFRVPNPEDRTPEQLERRTALGKQLQAIAAIPEPEPEIPE